jgi:hypothetical protein
VPRNKLRIIPAHTNNDDQPCLDHPPSKELTKFDKMTNFKKLLKQMEKRYRGRLEVAEHFSGLINELESFSSIRFRVARALSICHEALDHGDWLPLVRGAAVPLEVHQRTVLRWVADYEEGTPALELAPPVEPGPDLEALKSLEKRRGTHQGSLAGLTQEEAEKQAEEQAPLHEPPPPPPRDPPLTKEEKRHWNFRCAVRMFLAEVPPNQKTEEIRVAIGEEMTAELGDNAESFLVEPLEPTFDLSGRRRQPETMPEPGPEHEIAAFRQLVRALIASAVEHELGRVP